MSDYDITPSPKPTDLKIWAYIAQDNEDAAGSVWSRRLYDDCQFVAQSPLRGHSRKDLTSRALRFWTLTRYSHYTIVYRPDTGPVTVVAVLHGKRGIARILRERRQ